MRASPFIDALLYSAKPESLEGEDGTIKKTIINSAKDFAMDIAAEIGGKYDGFAVDVSASFAMDSNYQIQSNEVILKASHTIDKGKSIFHLNNIRMTKEAKIALATDPIGYHNQYGTHFIVGFVKKCTMDVYYRRETESEEDK